MTKKEIVKLIVQVIIAALTALGTSLGVVIRRGELYLKRKKEASPVREGLLLYQEKE